LYIVEKLNLLVLCRAWP